MAQQSVAGPCDFAKDLVNVIDHDGKSVSVDDFTGEGKYVGLYFSAHWCPPCRGFTPELAKFYESVKKDGKKLEIIFISSDRDDKSFKEYFDTMPWLAVKYDDRETKTAMCNKFGVRGIPMFVLLDGKTGDVLIANARGNITQDPTGEKFPW